MVPEIMCYKPQRAGCGVSFTLDEMDKEHLITAEIVTREGP
jgi:hypothetical protein